MIKRLLVLATMTFAIAFVAVPKASAAMCPTGQNYAQYMALGSCEIDGLQFSNFMFNSGGTTTIPASSVGVLPLTTAGNEGLDFNPAIILGGGGNQVADVALS
jgi:hypothetical protein